VTGPADSSKVPPPGTRCRGERRACSAIAVRIMQGRPLCAECVAIRTEAKTRAKRAKRAVARTEARVQAIERMVSSSPAPGTAPAQAPRPDCGLADKLELEAGNYVELDDGHSPPGCVLVVHDACEDIGEEPVDAFLSADAAGLRRLARWLSAWADELDARAREGR